MLFPLELQQALFEAFGHLTIKHLIKGERFTIQFIPLIGGGAEVTLKIDPAYYNRQQELKFLKFIERQIYTWNRLKENQ